MRKKRKKEKNKDISQIHFWVSKVRVSEVEAASNELGPAKGRLAD